MRRGIDVRARASEAPARCVFCHDEEGPFEAVCADCGARIHAECAGYVDGCTTPGCEGGFPAARLPEGAASPRPGQVTRPRPRRRTGRRPPWNGPGVAHREGRRPRRREREEARRILDAVALGAIGVGLISAVFTACLANPLARFDLVQGLLALPLGACAGAVGGLIVALASSSGER